MSYVVLQSHTERTGFLITQFPLPDTVIDFWRMVKDHNSTMVIVLGSYQDVNPVRTQYNCFIYTFKYLSFYLVILFFDLSPFFVQIDTMMF